MRRKIYEFDILSPANMRDAMMVTGKDPQGK